jgi:adenylate cyclase
MNAPRPGQPTSPVSGQDLISRITSSAAELNATRERVLGVLREQVRVPVEEMLRCSAAFSVSAGANMPDEMARFAEAARHLLLILDTTTAATAAMESKPSFALGQGDGSGDESLPPEAPGGGSLLIVDDHVDSVETLRQILEIKGYSVESCGSGEDALLKLEGGKFDLVLLDLRLPGIDGFEVVARMRSNQILRHTPIIMLSGDDQQDSIVRGIELGAEDFLAKPFNPVLLRARIESSLQKKRLRDHEQSILDRLRFEQEKSDALLLNILPKPVADRLKEGHGAVVDSFPEVTVLFADLVGFTALAATRSPAEVVRWLNLIFSEFDRLAELHQLEKIKTIGDSYMAVSGIPEQRANHAEAAAGMALDMQEAIARLNTEHETAWQLRVGLHTGPVIAGIIGTKKFAYDLWGDTVNTASRMESHGSPGQIQVSDATYYRLRGWFKLSSRGQIEVKGKGPMTTYLLEGR